MNHNIEQLAREKDFSALSALERERVLDEMPQAAYEQLRRVMQTAPRLESEALPPAHLRERLLARMREQPSVEPRPAARWRVPLWQTAAAALGCLALGAWLAQRPVRVETRTVLKTKTDTVYLEKILWRERIRYVRISEKHEPLPVIPVMAIAPEIPDSLFETPETVPVAVGMPLSEAPELMQFFTQGDER